MPRVHHNVAEPVCGKCGYCVRGITSLVCPECGSDLREVGIITPNTPLPLPNYVKAIFWTLLLPIVGFLLSMLMLSTILPYSVTRKVNRVIFCQAPYLNVTLQVYGSHRLAAPGMANRSPPPIDEIMIVDQASRNLLQADLSSGAFDYWKGNNRVQQPGGFSSQTIAQWLSPLIATPGDSRGQKMSDGVYTAITEIRNGNAGKFTPILDANGQQIGIAHPAFYWTVRDEPHPAVIIGLCAFWLAIWLYGIRRIYARRHGAIAPQLP